MTGDVAIVGGSLAGLATGIGLARRGILVNVFEQNTGEERGGTGLGVDRALITETTGVDARVDGPTPALPVVDEGYRETSTWLALYRWLRAVADTTDGLGVHESTRVDLISSDDHRAYLSGPRITASADIIIGADGYRSVVRRAVSPTRPFAPYGGFLLWRGLVEESWLPKQMLAKTSLGGGRSPHPEAARLVVYRVPGPNGETTPVSAPSHWPGTTQAAHNGYATGDTSLATRSWGAFCPPPSTGSCAPSSWRLHRSGGGELQARSSARP